MAISIGLLREYIHDVEETEDISDSLKKYCCAFKEYAASPSGFDSNLDRLSNTIGDIKLLELFAASSSLENCAFIGELVSAIQSESSLTLAGFRTKCLSRGMENKTIQSFCKKIFFLSAFGILKLTLSPNYTPHLFEEDIKLLSSSYDADALNSLTIAINEFNEVDTWQFKNDLEVLPAQIELEIGHPDALWIGYHSLFTYLQKKEDELNQKMEVADDLKKELTEAKNERNAFVANLVTVASLVLSIFTLINLQPELINGSIDIFQVVLIILSTLFSIILLLYVVLTFVWHSSAGSANNNGHRHLNLLVIIAGAVLAVYLLCLGFSGYFSLDKSQNNSAIQSSVSYVSSSSSSHS